MLNGKLKATYYVEAVIILHFESHPSDQNISQGKYVSIRL